MPSGYDAAVEDVEDQREAEIWGGFPTGVTHACPPDGSNVMPCCERTPFEVPRVDRMTLQPLAVSCTGAAS